MLEKREITKELGESYLDYAMSVIVSRALPDVRDGLKPVHRRVLWAMWDSGLTYQAKTRKSANVVGETMARYHPHGDSAIYDTLVRMAQDFSLRYPLIKGQGNFGSIDGDSPAAMRYCLTGNSLVITEKGLIPISSVSDGNEDIGIKILSKGRKIHNASKWFDSGRHPTLKAITNNGLAVQGSYNHPILTWTRHQISGEPMFQWKTLDTVMVGDVAVIDRTPDVLWPEKLVEVTAFHPRITNRKIQEKILPQTLDEDLAHILGAFLSEGSIAEHEIEFCNSDSEWMKDFSERWGRVFPDCRLHHFHRKPSSFGKKPYETFEIHSRQVVEFLRQIGLAQAKAKDKKIPFSILQSPKLVVAEFLRSYFEGDGSISFSGKKMVELSAISVSEELIKQLQIVLLRFGIIATKRFDSYRNTHKLYIRGLKNYRIFRDEIGFVSGRKSQKLDEAIERLEKEYSQTDFVPFLSSFARKELENPYGDKSFAAKHNFDRYGAMKENYSRVLSATRPSMQLHLKTIFEELLENNYVFDPIVSIEDVGMANVYSVKVESDCHSFVANGFINHNTEAKLAAISEEMLADIEKDTVDWTPNYDATREEPRVLPAKLPNLLLNGTLGIAVGMATSIPPHNLTEVCDAILHLADNPDATNEDILQFIKGPDFPTGGIIYNSKGIKEAYISGRGAVLARAKAEIVENKAGKQFDIVITEIPYQVNKSELIKNIAELAQEKKIEGIRDLRDESDREGMRIVIELKNDVPPQKVLNWLYKHTDLEKNFNLNMIALVNGIEPRLLAIRDFLVEYIAHRKEIIRRRTQFDLRKAQERAHILEGLAKALDAIDRVIATIKKSKDKDEAHVNLVKLFKLSDIQATAILEMRLQTLAALESKKIEDELKEKRALIEELNLILKSPAKILKIIKEEVTGLKEKYGDERRTQVVSRALEAMNDEDLIADEDAIVTISSGGYIKRLPPDTFKSQKRGGKGLIGSDVAEDDFLLHFFSARTHDNVLFFTGRGRVFQTKVHEIPQATRTSKGKAIQNFLELPADETVTAIVNYSAKGSKRADQAAKKYLMMMTKQGNIKKTLLQDFENIRRTGIIAIKLKSAKGAGAKGGGAASKSDQLKWAKLTGGTDEVVLATRQGQSIRFNEKLVRPMGRTAAGVRAIKLKKQNDEVAGFDIITKGEDAKLLVVMENGFAKQTPLKEYKTQGRGGSGIKTADITPKTGPVVSAHVLTDEKEVFALSAKGQMIRTELGTVRTTGRSAQGVRIMNLKDGDRVAGTIVV